MQPEAHRIENIKNSREVGFYWIACKRTMNARPGNPRFLCKVRDIVKERSIYAVGSFLPRARLWAVRRPDGFLRHVTSNKKAGISADLVCWRSRNNARSVSRCDRRPVTTEAVVDARGDHIHVLGDPAVGKAGGKQREARERIIGIAHITRTFGVACDREPNICYQPPMRFERNVVGLIAVGRLG